MMRYLFLFFFLLSGCVIINDDRLKKVDVFQSAHHRQHTEKAGECLEIEIGKVFFVRGNEKTGDNGGKHGNQHDHILFDKTGKMLC